MGDPRLNLGLQMDYPWAAQRQSMDNAMITHGKYGKMLDLGSGGSGGSGGLFVLQFFEKAWPKISLDFCTSNFSISLWENPKTIRFQGFLIFECVHDAPNQLFSNQDIKLLQNI